VLLSWLIPSLCLWLLVVLSVIRVCAAAKTIDAQLARERGRRAR
jgi:hypothetical protein